VSTLQKSLKNTAEFLGIDQRRKIRIKFLTEKLELEKMHYITNESVEAIVKGLDVRKDDRILAICGSGAQGFAMLEYVSEGKIVAIDRKDKQLEHASRLKDMLQAKEFEKFSAAHIAPRNNGYFSNIPRLEKISSNINNIEFNYADLADFKEDIFNKVYLSNATIKPQDIKNIVPVGGLVYISKFPWGYFDKNVHVQHVDEKDIAGIFEIDHGKTLTANCLECAAIKAIDHPLYDGARTPRWDPVVLRRI